jgi:hypothetical protein
MEDDEHILLLLLRAALSLVLLCVAIKQLSEWRTNIVHDCISLSREDLFEGR